jgi:hypothetical protein
MKTYPKIIMIAMLLWAAVQGSTMVRAQSADDQAVKEMASEAPLSAAPTKSSKHLKLCAQLGLQVLSGFSVNTSSLIVEAQVAQHWVMLPEVQFDSVPETSTFALFGMALAGSAARRRVR